VGFPWFHYFGTGGDLNVMVIDRLGKSLEDLQRECGGRFGLKTVLMVADQLIDRVECIHNRSYLHRDIKPENFVMGRRARARVVHVIDFDLAKLYLDPQTQQHIRYREGKHPIGTSRFASIRTHLGIGTKTTFICTGKY
jgi:serine/threonine protein kinase